MVFVASASQLEFQLLFSSFGALNGSANVHKGSIKHLLLSYLHYELIQNTDDTCVNQLGEKEILTLLHS